MLAFAIISITLTVAGIIGICAWLCKGSKYKDDMTNVAGALNGTIKEAFNARNNIDHCPKCGSTNIKLYRKGYNYKVGFWGAIFGVRGAGYAGGFDANHTCCRCMDCGKDWETDYDYRLIEK